MTDITNEISILREKLNTLEKKQQENKLQQSSVEYNLSILQQSSVEYNLSILNNLLMNRKNKILEDKNSNTSIRESNCDKQYIIRLEAIFNTLQLMDEKINNLEMMVIKKR